MSCTSRAPGPSKRRRSRLSPEQLEARLAPSARAPAGGPREAAGARCCDDKILTAWNGLMIAAYADGYRVLKDAKYRKPAEKAADFLLEKLRTRKAACCGPIARAGQDSRLPGGLRLPGARSAPAARRRPATPAGCGKPSR